ncbi:MAG TPA: M50 family metallopeptidase [Acidimicrobiales bacterium]|nr:M50 family metallopeptidase [Acidimicrobiales bacterium]
MAELSTTRGTPMDLREQRGALLRLAVVVAAGLVVADLFGALDTVLVVLALVVMIVLHEFGHFVTAKLAGMKVTEFYVGFGPRVWSVTKGETTYGVKALPLGGYCRIVGMTNAEEVAPEDEPRAYRNQPTWRRLTVACAGSFTHFVLALLLLVVLFWGPGDIGNFITNPAANNPIAAVDTFTHGKSPAQLAGLRPGDRIIAINGHHFSNWDQLSAYLKARPGGLVVITVERDGRTVVLRPVRLANGAKVVIAGQSTPIDNRPTGFLGIEVSDVSHFGLIGSVEHAGTAFGSTVVYSVTSIGHVVGNVGQYLHMVANPQAAATGKRFVSPIGVVKLANEATQVGWSEVLYLLILINIFIGIFNMAPLLPMDGGHVVIALYEKVRSLLARRPYHADVNKMAPIVYAVIGVLLFYAVTAMFMDLRQVLA